MITVEKFVKKVVTAAPDESLATKGAPDNGILRWVGGHRRGLETSGNHGVIHRLVPTCDQVLQLGVFAQSLSQRKTFLLCADLEISPKQHLEKLLISMGE